MSTGSLTPSVGTSPSPRRTLQSKYNPINGKNLVPKHSLLPFNKPKLDQLPSKSDFDQICKIHTVICSNGYTATVLLENLTSSGFSIGKIYQCADRDTDSKRTQLRINKCWTEYQVVKHCGLAEYFGIYYDSASQSLIIHQQAYSETLHRFVARSPRITESKCKSIAKDILLSLWRLHNSGFVHMDIKPDNIMHRQLDHLYESDHIADGWLLIDFNEIRKHKTVDHYIGTMGWSAPEIEYNAEKNSYRKSADIFSFGLVILYILLGEQPLQIPEEQRAKYRVETNDDEKAILMKKVLRKQILTNWYYGVVAQSEPLINRYLFSLYQERKISMHLYRLLRDGILNHDPKKRMDCKQIFNSTW
eukprot:CAMPEP_0197033406 /NCGR_PEP_ID=MMETSP1384-20130603/11825_1 /TAXON_ID=29189 /ORGANISM="Ammonia sp." /LENGTH=360 /DNA_ID=CAMNT_0042463211 /DNA_START=32 /DNA_END=1111 /DNA_ORIENTATION=-